MRLCQDRTGSFGRIQSGEVFRLSHTEENELNIMPSVAPDTSQAIESLPILKLESHWCVNDYMSNLTSPAFAQAQVGLTKNECVPVSIEGLA